MLETHLGNKYFGNGGDFDYEYTSYFCDKCNKNIEEGFVFHGNVNLINKGENIGGVIGNSFDINLQRQPHKKIPLSNFVQIASLNPSEKTINELEEFLPKLVSEYHYCIPCSFNILELHKYVSQNPIIAQRVQIND